MFPCLVPIGKAHLEANDPSDVLSEVSIQQQQHNTVASATPLTLVTRTIPGVVTTTTASYTPQPARDRITTKCNTMDQG